MRAYNSLPPSAADDLCLTLNLILSDRLGHGCDLSGGEAVEVTVVLVGQHVNNEAGVVPSLGFVAVMVLDRDRHNCQLAALGGLWCALTKPLPALRTSWRG